MSFQKLNQIPFRTDNGVGTDGPEIKLVLLRDSRIKNDNLYSIGSV